MKKLLDLLCSGRYYWRKSPWLRRTFLLLGSLVLLTVLVLSGGDPRAGLFPHAPLFALAGAVLYVLVLLILLVFYLARFHPGMIEDDKHLFLLGVILVAVGYLSKALYIHSGYLAPAGAAAILVAILCHPGVVPVLAAVLALIIGMLTGDFAYAAVALAGGVVGGLSVSRVAKRSDITGIPFLLLLTTNAAVIVAFSLLRQEPLSALLRNQLYGAINAVASVVVALGSLPFLENLFGITTAIRLLELSNPSEPLLHKLLTQAPGTYHHSLIVANLAEQAAQAIGADPLLARVGALYHDIGKAKNPYFFVENQFGGENPHEKLSPNLSTLIITSHIRDGVEMADLHKLPPVIQDFITQHHGTTLIQYFYHQALTNEGPEKVSPDHYRHDGPKPQSKETAIVLLADEVEASTRAITKPTPAKIEETVRQVVEHVTEDGQLDECPLSFKDLSVITGTFVKLLCGMYHSRIEYPDKRLIEMAERKAAEKGKIERGKIVKFGK